MIIGVARKSRPTQNIKRQVRNIQEKYPGIEVIEITYTGAKVVNYKKFVNVVKRLKEGDKIVFDSASRMSRNSKEGCELYEDLFNRGVSIEFLKEPYINSEVFKQALNNQIQIKLQTGNEATDELMNTIIEALNKFTIQLAKDQIKKVFDQAEKELTDLHQRTAEGIETARLEGKQIGRVEGTKVETKKAKATKEIILKHSKDFNGNLTDVECMKLAGVHRETYYIYKKQLREKLEAEG